MSAAGRFLLTAVACGIATAQTQAPPAQEVEQRETPTTFSARVNLVVIPVVVRDRKGRAVGNLTKEDFQLSEKGRAQTITRFVIEKAGERAAVEATQIESPASNEPGTPATSAGIPTRFVAYLFDDLHLNTGYLLQLRIATVKHLTETLKPSDRAAVYTTSGIGMRDFTHNHEEIVAAIEKIIPRHRATPGFDCPPVTFYMADRIVHNDQAMLADVTNEAVACANLIVTAGPGGGPGGGTPPPSAAQAMAMSAASSAVAVGESQIQQTLNLMKDVVRRMSASPGQRMLVLLSPGFLITTNYRQDEMELMDRAIRANVTINVMNARGLYVPDAVTEFGPQAIKYAKMLEQPLRDSASAEDEVLGEIAEGTGGTFFHNNNDYREGLRQTSVAPEFVYLVGFSPQNLRYDGSFHAVKVSLKPKDFSMQSRRGYYSPKHAATEEEQTLQELREAVFSREEVQEFGLGLQTQFFKPTEDSAKLTVLAHVDLKPLRFRTEAGANHDTLIVVSSLFDSNGNALKAIQRNVAMHLKPETFQARLNQGIAVRTTFDVKPGKYLLRVVVRDSEGQMMSTKNGIVDIP
jgi:VWFA-related protein